MQLKIVVFDKDNNVLGINNIAREHDSTNESIEYANTFKNSEKFEIFFNIKNALGYSYHNTLSVFNKNIVTKEWEGMSFDPVNISYGCIK